MIPTVVVGGDPLKNMLAAIKGPKVLQVSHGLQLIDCNDIPCIDSRSSKGGSLPYLAKLSLMTGTFNGSQ
jgi:hypothetical protein